MNSVIMSKIYKVTTGSKEIGDTCLKKCLKRVENTCLWRVGLGILAEKERSMGSQCKSLNTI